MTLGVEVASIVAFVVLSSCRRGQQRKGRRRERGDGRYLVEIGLVPRCSGM